jgi:integration host factor subunit alpha
VTKSHISRNVRERSESPVSRREAAALVNEVFGLVKEALARGDRVLVTGFGRFDTLDKHERKGRNPQTGEPVVIEARRVVRFKSSDLLKNEVASRDHSPASDAASASRSM